MISECNVVYKWVKGEGSLLLHNLLVLDLRENLSLLTLGATEFKRVLEESGNLSSFVDDSAILVHDNSAICVPLVYNPIAIASISASVLGRIRGLKAVGVNALRSRLSVQLRIVAATPRDIIGHPVALIVQAALPHWQVRAVSSPDAISSVATIA